MREQYLLFGHILPAQTGGSAELPDLLARRAAAAAVVRPHGVLHPGPGDNPVAQEQLLQAHGINWHVLHRVDSECICHRGDGEYRVSVRGPVLAMCGRARCVYV